VVENTAYQSALWKDHRMFFIPLMRRPPSDDSPIETDDGLYVNAIVLETSKPINDLENQVRSTMASINPNLTLQNFKPFSEQISTMFTEEKLVAKLSTLFGGACKRGEYGDARGAGADAAGAGDWCAYCVFLRALCEDAVV